MCICILQLPVSDTLHSSSDHVHLFTPIQFVQSWLGGVPFKNSQMLRAYVRFVEVCK